MSEWQPIETAPKDGTRVLLSRVNEWVCEGWFSGSGEGWFEANNDPTDCWGGQIYPTHWMPLPAPPAKEPAHD